jgi:MFS family permease
MGAGGINMIVDVIISDLVPLRERGNYMAFFLVVYFVGTALGPYAGGAIVENTSLHWVFYINLPVSRTQQTPYVNQNFARVLMPYSHPS